MRENFHERDRDELMIAQVRSTSPPPLPTDGQRYLEYSRGLIQLHNITGISPGVKVLNGEVTKEGDLAIAGGTYSDIWLGRWLGEKTVNAHYRFRLVAYLNVIGGRLESAP